MKRPMISAEYQEKMGAIDNHNWRRQSGKGTEALERVCVTRSSKDRIFINVVGWIIVNMYLAKKHFYWVGDRVGDAMSSSEFQEAVAMCLIKNQHLSEAGSPNDPAAGEPNDISNLGKHPKYKSNMCKFCFKRKTVYICKACSTPGRAKPRTDKGPKGGARFTDPGYMHFCRGGCFNNHKCGSTSSRRPRGSLREREYEI